MLVSNLEVTAQQQQLQLQPTGVEQPQTGAQMINTTTTATTTTAQLDDLFGKDDEDELPTCISQIEMQANVNNNVNNNANDNNNDSSSGEEEEEEEEEEEGEEEEGEEEEESSQSVTESQGIEEINLSCEEGNEELATAVTNLLQVTPLSLSQTPLLHSSSYSSSSSFSSSTSSPLKAEA